MRIMPYRDEGSRHRTAARRRGRAILATRRRLGHRLSRAILGMSEAVGNGVGRQLNNRRSARVRSEGLERSNPKTGTVFGTNPKTGTVFGTNPISARGLPLVLTALDGALWVCCNGFFV